MFKSSILKLPTFFLSRHKTLFQQTLQRKLTITSPLFQEKKKQNNSNSEKKTENKGTKFQEAKKRIYYKFFCKCGVGFDAFPEFLDHIWTSHQIENLNFPEILAKRDGSKWDIKFYWHLTCQCGHKFSSSLCNAYLKVNSGRVDLLKKYHLRCLKCKNIAQFDNERLLDEFLKERVKQKLIYSVYKEKFVWFKSESHSERILEGHIKELCEKCRLSPTGYCGDELNYQEQINQIHYISPFMKR